MFSVMSVGHSFCSRGGPHVVGSNFSILFAILSSDKDEKSLSCSLSLGVNVKMLIVRACLHVTSLSLCPSQSLSKFDIVPMETDCLTDRMGSEPNLSVTIHTMKVEGHCDNTCKQALTDE